MDDTFVAKDPVPKHHVPLAFLRLCLSLFLLFSPEFSLLPLLHADPTISLEDATNGVLSQLIGTPGKGLQIFTNGAAPTLAASFLANGNVGIGTANPSSRFEAAGGSVTIR